MLPHLRAAEKILLLGRSPAGLLQGINPINPLTAPRANVPTHDRAEREAVDSKERLAVHFPGQEDLVLLDFPPRHRHGVVEDLPPV